MGDITNFFGWELLYNIQASNINKSSDLIIAFVHFLLVKQKFLCVGLGESKTLDESETKSEILPNGWSDDCKYAIRYVFDKKIYVLLGNTIETSLLINLLSGETNKVSNISLISDEIVKKLNGSLDEMIPNAAQLAVRLDKELINPVFPGSSKDSTSQTEVPTKREDDPLRIGRPRNPLRYEPEGHHRRPFGFPDVGRSDLNPFGGLGSGNLLQFPHPSSGFGARYDPINALDPNIPNRPNPDHFRPPSFNDFDFI